MYEKNLLETLCSNADNEISHIHKCGNVHCFARLQEYVKLYMTVRIHHAIKISNMRMSFGYERNKKDAQIIPRIKSSLLLYINIL